MKPNAHVVKVLAFDVFGTTVDWHGSIVREGAVWSCEKKLDIDWSQFAERWRAGYQPALERVRRGELPWMKLDEIHRGILDEVLVEFKVTGLSDEEKDQWNGVWHRLAPWPDAIEGLVRLKKHFIIATLSNGNVSLLVDIAKYASLPWDAIISSELFRRYKPDAANYLGAADLLGCEPDDLMMVAAHPSDLKAARECGLKTAFVRRPLEHGAQPAGTASVSAAPGAASDPSAPAWDVTAADFIDLAAQLS
ncbi:MAG: haloacid dehalogenase type II [Acidobacteriota bacterium]|nr:haloacid dehalogenase type II [Acidobacteriota bacterium]